jgi:hypothetical protein
VIENNLKLNIEEFTNFVNIFSCPLISYANYALPIKNKENIINTNFLGKTHSVSSRLEEILDHYNTINNMKWKSLRENVAAIKLFTNAAYITLHLKSTSPQYRLLSGIDIFLEDTEKVLDIFYSALQSSFNELVKNGKNNGLENCREIDSHFSFSVNYPEGILESDIKKRHIDTPEKVIVNVATSYLNLACDSDVLKKVKNAGNKNYEDLIPEVISENIIRILENKYHNLQSLYDTYISNSDIEDLDNDLKLIRGHVSIVFHLLEASTGLIHYFERHIMEQPELSFNSYKSPVSNKEILGILVDYFLNYADQFLTGGVTLCREVIKKYAEVGSITVKVPAYRGFHVRPSTLVSKIVQHYGSEVHLVTGNEKYDASHPMELFCVNEKINAEKRRNLSRNICELQSIKNPECSRNFKKGLKNIFNELQEKNIIINYSSGFSLPDFKPVDEETLGEFANRAIAFLLAQGNIDLKTDMTVSFEGDKRVLKDLEILADCGYGEDIYGNNRDLPKELSYIRR